MAFISRATHTLQWPVQWVAKPQGGANPVKAGHSSDCGLQPAHMKSELLVTAGQPYCGEYVPGPCTHRPSRHGSWSRLKPVGQPQGHSRPRQGRRLGRSRNKVAVAEAAAG